MCTIAEKVNPQLSTSLCSHTYLPPLTAKELMSGIEKNIQMLQLGNDSRSFHKKLSPKLGLPFKRQPYYLSYTGHLRDSIQVHPQSCFLERRTGSSSLVRAKV